MTGVRVLNIIKYWIAYAIIKEPLIYTDYVARITTKELSIMGTRGYNIGTAVPLKFDRLHKSLTNSWSLTRHLGLTYSVKEFLHGQNKPCSRMLVLSWRHSCLNRYTRIWIPLSCKFISSSTRAFFRRISGWKGGDSGFCHHSAGSFLLDLAAASTDSGLGHYYDCRLAGMQGLRFPFLHSSY
jgi:hypothetical protein